MKTTYLAWKDPACGGVNPEWVTLTRAEYLALVKSNERFFERLESLEPDCSDGKFVIECTKTRYKSYLKEKRHRQYLKDSDPGFQVVSYHALEDADGCYAEELLPDETCNVEEECGRLLEIQAVRAAVAQLSEDEQHLVSYFYFSAKKGSERDYSAQIGIPRKTINYRRARILEKLKIFLK